MLGCHSYYEEKILCIFLPKDFLNTKMRTDSLFYKMSITELIQTAYSHKNIYKTCNQRNLSKSPRDTTEKWILYWNKNILTHMVLKTWNIERKKDYNNDGWNHKVWCIPWRL